jgi:hypothetical protein
MLPAFQLFVVFITAYFIGEYGLLFLWVGVPRQKHAGKLFSALLFALLTYLLSGVWRFWFFLPIFSYFMPFLNIYHRNQAAAGYREKFFGSLLLESFQYCLHD